MCEVHGEVQRINEDVVGSEAESSMDHCLLWQLEKRTDGLMSELADVCCGILMLDHCSEELLDHKSSLKKALYTIDLKVKRLLHEQTKSPKLISGISTGVKLSKSVFLVLMVILWTGVPFGSSFISPSWHEPGMKEHLQDVEKLKVHLQVCAGSGQMLDHHGMQRWHGACGTQWAQWTRIPPACLRGQVARESGTGLPLDTCV